MEARVTFQSPDPQWITLSDESEEKYRAFIEHEKGDPNSAGYWTRYNELWEDFLISIESKLWDVEIEELIDDIEVTE